MFERRKIADDEKERQQVLYILMMLSLSSTQQGLIPNTSSEVILKNQRVFIKWS